MKHYTITSKHFEGAAHLKYNQYGILVLLDLTGVQARAWSEERTLALLSEFAPDDLKMMLRLQNAITHFTITEVA